MAGIEFKNSLASYESSFLWITGTRHWESRIGSKSWHFHSRSTLALPYHFDPAQRPRAPTRIRELEPGAVCVFLGERSHSRYVSRLPVRLILRHAQPNKHTRGAAMVLLSEDAHTHSPSQFADTQTGEKISLRRVDRAPAA